MARVTYGWSRISFSKNGKKPQHIDYFINDSIGSIKLSEHKVSVVSPDEARKKILSIYKRAKDSGWSAVIGEL